MKQETVNTFNEGMNKDLNPIVTPNNLLTDNLNGTFLTYNGDELSLQNDAGNTRIPVKDTGDSVKLSEGFYPLGMKEYGGVLYIVSGKKGVNESGVLDPIYDEIEFGSYPSPELASYTTFKNEKTIFLSDNKDILYKSFVINNDYFKTGRFITFKSSSENLNFDNVWTAWNFQGLYIIKLYLKLDNGNIDLTDDVWEKFKVYKNQNPSDTANHWLLSKDFIYHCPFSYKGKLLVETVLSEPLFKISKYYEVISDESTGNFKAAFDIKIDNNSTPLKIVGYKAIFKGNTQWSTTIEPQTNPFDSNGFSKLEVTIPKNNSLLQYTIIPKFKYVKTGEIIPFDDFPIEFTNKYIISNKILLEEKYYNISFHTEESSCNSSEGKRYVKVFSLIGEKGRINNELSEIGPEEKPYVFVERGYSTSVSYNKIGEFINNNGVAQIINTTVSPSVKAILEEKLKSFPLSIIDPSCSKAIIRFRTSAPLDMISINELKTAKLILTQKNVIGVIPYESYDGRNFSANILTNEDLYVHFSTSSMEGTTTLIKKEELNFKDPYNLGIVLDFNKLTKLEVTPNQKNFTFSTGLIDSSLIELGRYIHEQFGTNTNGPKIDPVQENSTFKIIERRISFSGSIGQRGRFSVGVIDENFDFLKYETVYPYKIINAQIVGGKYYNLTRSVTSDFYIEIGNDTLGYLIFRRTGWFEITPVVNNPNIV